MQKARSFINAEFKGASDRAVAIVAAALLDEQLTEILRTFLVVQSGKDRLFDGPDALLSTFGTKIVLAYRLGLISELERDRLDFVRDVRNEFAHTFGPIDFSKSTIADRCRHNEIPIELVAPEFPEEWTGQAIPTPPLEKESSSNPRGLFQETIAYLVETLVVRRIEAENPSRKAKKPFTSWAELVSSLGKHAQDIANAAIKILGDKSIPDSEKEGLMRDIQERASRNAETVGHAIRLARDALAKWKREH